MKKTVLLLVAGVLLSGCQNTGTGSKNAQSPVINPMSATQPGSDAMSLASDSAIHSCSKELSALQKIAPTTYQRKNAELNNTLAQARLYLSVKESVSPNTAEIMDSAYKFKISKICNDIQSALTHALIDNAENEAQPDNGTVFSAGNPS